MKISTLVLAGSLLANVALVAAVMLRPQRTADNGAIPSSSTPAAAAVTPAATRSTAGAPTTPEANLPAAEVAARATWQRFHGGDLKLLADRLTAAGFPQRQVRSIVASEISERTANHSRAMSAALEQKNFWEQPNLTQAFFNQQNRELSAERARLFKEAYGEDYDRESYEGANSAFRQTFGDLPFETFQKIRKLQQDYNEMRQDIQAAMGDIGIPIPEDREKLALLDKARREDLAKLLTPEQLAEYEIRSDATSSQLRSRLGLLQPTEEEFRAIYRAQKVMESEFPTGGPTTPEQAKARQERQKEIDAQIMASLPPERATLYKLSTDPAYTQINRIATRFNLPTQTALDVVALQQATQQQMATLRTDRSLNAQQRNEQLTALQQDVQAKVAAAMGQRAYTAYQEYGGQWIQNMVPRPRPAAPVATPKN